jgi:SAM-dependent methyltransferase
MKCRHCSTPLEETFLDLGFAPPSNAYLSADDLVKPEKYYPLKIKVCQECWLVQTEDYADADELFSADYAYFSSTSQSWLAHAKEYAQLMIERLNLNQQSFVIEVASNDGYLLKNFVEAGIPCLGIEPTASTAAAAEVLGIPVLHEFFGREVGLKCQKADLIAGNNVYAHVPDINDFTQGLKAALKPEGVITLEFPHLLNLIEQNQFDTVYHEHFSYLSLYTVKRIFEKAGLRIWNVEKLSTHGGSLRIFGCHLDSDLDTLPIVETLLLEEEAKGLRTLSTYQSFQKKADKIKDDLLIFLIEQKRSGKIIAAYGAAAKGNTLLNYAGVKPDLLSYVVDAAPSKQGKYMPGSHIPIFHPERLLQDKLDTVLILPWNIAPEITQKNQALSERGTQFIAAVPELRVIE